MIKTDGTIIEFLAGSHSYEGVWFGQKHQAREGSYWWRKILREYISTQPQKVEVGGEGYSVEDVIEWTDWLGEMGWYRNKQGQWEHDNETGMFMSTTELINHYFLHSLKQKEG